MSELRQDERELRKEVGRVTHTVAVPSMLGLLTCECARAEGKPIPSELRREERELRRQVELEDDNTAVPRTHVDDEYARAGERDPRILVTTSRDPSSRLTQFAKELKLVFPNAQRINRGGQVRRSMAPPPACSPPFPGLLRNASAGCKDLEQP